MQLITPVDYSSDLPYLGQSDELLLMGSCFTTNIGTLLTDAKFSCNINPYGVLYNPLSISTALREVTSGKVYTTDDLLQSGERWSSYMHHSDFSASTPEEVLAKINKRLQSTRLQLPKLSALILTFGTAWVYELQENGRVVGNCHKQPDSLFRRRRLTPEEIVTDYTSLLTGLIARNPNIKVLLTVSPIRHRKDGLHENQLSKATLLLAADELKKTFPTHVFYFPAYELLMDELRDYRFYAEDMLHPSATAIRYVWEKFTEHCLTDDARAIMKEVEEVRKALQHKPFHPDSEAYKHFLEQIVLRINRLIDKYPYLDFQNEKEVCLTLLKQ
jgi:hypothetical protein